MNEIKLTLSRAHIVIERIQRLINQLQEEINQHSVSRITPAMALTWQQKKQSYQTQIRQKVLNNGQHFSLIRKLLAVFGEIRQKVGEANHHCGINQKMTEVKNLEKTIRTFEQYAGIIQSADAINYAHADEEVTTLMENLSLFQDEQVKNQELRENFPLHIGLWDENLLIELRQEIQTLSIRSQKLQDEIKDLNGLNTITLKIDDEIARQLALI